MKGGDQSTSCLYVDSGGLPLTAKVRSQVQPHEQVSEMWRKQGHGRESQRPEWY